MNIPSNAVPESPRDSQIIAPAVMSPARPLYWSLRRELWENRSIYIAPLAVAAVFLFGFLISAMGRGPSALNPVQQHRNIVEPYDFAAGLLMATQMLVGLFYCLEALHGERRDRSILFWKSLPVSDATTVLSKASIPIVILPLFTWVVTVAAQVIMILVSSAILLGSGRSAATLWTQAALFQMSLMLLYHLVTVHSLWHAPFYGWLLLISGWARRAVFLWAVLPPLAMFVLEKIVFNTSHFAAMLGRRLTGDPGVIAFPGRMPIDPGMQLTLGRYLASPGLWIGLIITAAFLAAAVRLRRHQGPI